MYVPGVISLNPFYNKSYETCFNNDIEIFIRQMNKLIVYTII